MKALIVALVSIFCMEAYCDALETPSHEIINEYIARGAMANFSLDSYLKDKVLLSKGIEERIDSNEVWWWLRKGGIYEDKPPESVIPYRRSRNHFHNPLLPWDQAGYSGYLSFCDVGHCPKSAILWAQGPQESDTILGFELNPGGDWSWSKARENFFAALTSDNETGRAASFAETFRGLGQVMHLLEDMSVPEHTRNTFHPSGGYEGWVLQNVFTNNISNYQPSVSQFFGGSVNDIGSFFDTNQYSGSNPEVTLFTAGLSEYSNANFFTPSTIFSADFSNPKKVDTTLKPEIVTAEDGETDVVNYLYLNGQNHKLAAESYFANVPLVGSISEGWKYNLDDNVYKAYAHMLMPRAIGYSAGLLQYFFRGAIELTFPDPPNQRYSYIRLKAKNITANGEEMTDADQIRLVVRYKLMQEDAAQGKIVKAGDDYHYIVVPPKNAVSGIAKDAPVDLEFDLSASPLPMWAFEVTLQVVFKGKIGNESGAVALGMTKLPSAGGDIEIALPDNGVYGITAPNGAFTDFRVKATNVSTSAEAMSNGYLELILRYKQAQQDPFQNQPTDKSPEDPEYYYVRVPEKSGVRSIPIGSSVDLHFDLSAQPLTLTATDVYAYVAYTGEVGTRANETAFGFRDIAEPTPIDIVNNMDRVCINGSYLLAGSQDAIDAVGTDAAGRPMWDIYPHRLKDVYLSFSSFPASATNYSAKFPYIEPGAHGRAFILTDYGLNVSSSVTVENIESPLLDVWGLTFVPSVDSIDGVLNQLVYDQGEYLDHYPRMYTERGLKSWWYTHYENQKWPADTTCDSSAAHPDLVGPATLEIPQ